MTLPNVSGHRAAVLGGAYGVAAEHLRLARIAIARAMPKAADYPDTAALISALAEHIVQIAAAENLEKELLKLTAHLGARIKEGPSDQKGDRP